MVFVKKPIPVVPGRTPEDVLCAACRHHTAYVHKETHGGIDMLLCTNVTMCVNRLRDGQTWAEFMQGIREESVQWTARVAGSR